MQNEIDIKIKETTLPITAVTTVTPETPTEENKVLVKNRYSKKIKCPRCGHHPLEIYNFLDTNGKKVCDVYVCHKHNDTPSFFIREECDKI